MVGRISTGEIEDKPSSTPARAKGGKAGGKARAEALTPEARQEIGKRAAESRWRKSRKQSD